jgi:hypothetical protein
MMRFLSSPQPTAKYRSWANDFIVCPPFVAVYIQEGVIFMSVTKEEILDLFRQSESRMQETEKMMRENAKQIKEVSRAIGRLGNRLGEFVEEMVRPAAVRLFQERGIAVHQVAQRVYLERDGYATEIDLMVINGTDVILIEAKSALSVQDIDEHLERLAHFKNLSPQYLDFNVMGAVAGMVVPDDAARYAYRKGLFVLGQSGETVTIRNDLNFQLAVW